MSSIVVKCGKKPLATFDFTRLGIAIAVVDGQVHLFVKLRQDMKISDVVRNIKANSSGWIHKTFSDLRDFAWQRGYGAFTVSFSQYEAREEIRCRAGKASRQDFISRRASRSSSQAWRGV